MEEKPLEKKEEGKKKEKEQRKYKIKVNKCLSITYHVDFDVILINISCIYKSI